MNLVGIYNFNEVCIQDLKYWTEERNFKIAVDGDLKMVFVLKGEKK